MYKEIRTIKPQVEKVLSNSKEARNSDKELILQVWEACGLVLDEKQREIWKKLPSSESIRRTRQKFQEEGKYTADHEVIKAREENRKNMEAENIRKRLPKDNCFKCGVEIDYVDDGIGYCDSCKT